AAGRGAARIAASPDSTAKGGCTEARAASRPPVGLASLRGSSAGAGGECRAAVGGPQLEGLRDPGLGGPQRLPEPTGGRPLGPAGGRRGRPRAGPADRGRGRRARGGPAVARAAQTRLVGDGVAGAAPAAARAGREAAEQTERREQAELDAEHGDRQALLGG